VPLGRCCDWCGSILLDNAGNGVREGVFGLIEGSVAKAGVLAESFEDLLPVGQLDLDADERCRVSCRSNCRRQLGQQVEIFGLAIRQVYLGLPAIADPYKLRHAT
jgi:hypothetical protein